MPSTRPRLRSRRLVVALAASILGSAAWLTVLPLVPGPARGAVDPQQDAQRWLDQARTALVSSPTAEWDARVEVIETPPRAEQGRKAAFLIGTTGYHFQVKGHGRVHWVERADGRGRPPSREAWYEGYTCYLRSAEAPGRLLPIDLGEWEGPCVRRSLVDGGVLGWRLAHGLDNEEAGSLYVAAMGVEWVREEEVMGRPAVVLDVTFGFGFGPYRPRKESGTSRLWLDRETRLPLKRETRARIDPREDAPVIRVRETYSDWKLGQPMADATFHTEGMGPRDALVDSPEEPAAFEAEQTRKFLGFGVRDFPGPQGPTGFDEVPDDAPVFPFSIMPRALSGPEPLAWFHDRKRVAAKGPDGTEVEGVLGWDDQVEKADRPGFRSTRENRRHLYGFGAFHPEDILIGRRTGGGLRPSLFFRDVGSHSTSPHHLAVDRRGRCHLMVADVDIGQDNRFKLLWLIGDPSSGKWAEAWLVDHRERFTSSAIPWSAAWGETVHLVWTWNAGQDGEGSGIFHVAWTPEGFGRKVRIHRGEARGVDLAVDPDTGRLVLVFSTEDGVFVASRPSGGPWTRAARLHPGIAEWRDVSIQPLGRGEMVIRTRRGKTEEWLIQGK